MRVPFPALGATPRAYNQVLVALHMHADSIGGYCPLQGVMTLYQVITGPTKKRTDRCSASRTEHTSS